MKEKVTRQLIANLNVYETMFLEDPLGLKQKQMRPKRFYLCLVLEQPTLKCKFKDSSATICW